MFIGETIGDFSIKYSRVTEKVVFYCSLKEKDDFGEGWYV